MIAGLLLPLSLSDSLAVSDVRVAPNGLLRVTEIGRPSDVCLGVALGVTSAEIVNGRWRIFGIRPPGSCSPRPV